MKRIALVAAFAACSLQAEVAFHKCSVTVDEGKKVREMRADLAFTDSKELIVRYAGKNNETGTVAKIPFDQIDKMDYEFSKRHRVREGGVLMVASLGAGAVVMMTKSTSHWFNVDYHEGKQAKSLLLKLDKGEYKEVLDAAESQTGKMVERAVKAGANPQKKKK